MKFLYDYFPILCFFIAYKLYGIYVATAVTMIASLLQLGVYWFAKKRLENLHLITFILIVILGSATLLFHNAIFIKWKPSVIYWVFAIFLLGSQYFGKKPLLYRFLGKRIELPDRIWKHVNFSWGIFFLLMGLLNLYVAYHYSTNVWVDFKLFGTLGLILLFTVTQVIYMSRHIKEQKKTT